MAKKVQEREVVGPAGGKFTVLTDEEEASFRDLCNRYTTDNHFQNVSDLQDLERIVNLEVLSSRYANWLSTETDYYGETIESKEISGIIKDFSMELRQLKKAIGVDRVSRQKDSSESVADYLENLRQRAKEFGVTREKQLTEALTLWNDLVALITLHDNCTEEERKQQHCELKDIMNWLRETAIPQYNEIDAYFVEHSQAYWVREM